MVKFLNQRCIHCLRFCEELTEDHILPKAWYPNDLASNTEKWAAPACRNCNNKLGRIEEDLLLRLGMCIDNSNGLSAGINEKVLRMISPDLGKDNRSQFRKEAAFKKVTSDLQPCVAGYEYILKNANHWHDPDEGSIVRIPRKELVAFIIKITKGLEYQLCKRYVEETSKIIAYWPRQNNPDDDKLFQKFQNRIDSCLQTARCGQSFTVDYGVNPHNPGNVIYKILIWGKTEFWSQVYPKDMFRV